MIYEKERFPSKGCLERQRWQTAVSTTATAKQMSPKVLHQVEQLFKTNTKLPKPKKAGIMTMTPTGQKTGRIMVAQLEIRAIAHTSRQLTSRDSRFSLAYQYRDRIWAVCPST